MKRLFVGFALFAAACSGAPISPSPIVSTPVVLTGSSIATLAVLAFTMTEVGSQYAPQIEIAETSGLSGATLTDVSFHLTDGRWEGFLPGDRHVAAGGTLKLFERVYGDYQFAMSSRSDIVEVFFVDDGGQAGSARATVSK